ncbi:hypothetical protein CDAR_502581 [Caerostris darwini]|uniref:Uncharacterized protein n=1 Tax=Caerostris darwini TaxID=1538125 RepID=A0AAV4VRV8_9ARAC|nr:hypothetical protein CDAR_502491 [Caerostris darwini]GIY72075.1 hypothetical protein CDAR_502581 [Caerostris darwini]
MLSTEAACTLFGSFWGVGLTEWSRLTEDDERSDRGYYGALFSSVLRYLGNQSLDVAVRILLSSPYSSPSTPFHPPISDC